MDPAHYYSLPEAKLLLDHLHKINPKYGIEIVFPKKKWAGIDLTQNDEAMSIINRHHEVFKDSSGNDFGLKFIIGASTSADLWVHILDENKNIIGFSTNECHQVNSNSVNYFRVTLFKKIIQRSGIYPFVQELRYAIFPSDLIISRTQHPVVYNTFKELCSNHGMLISPTVNNVYPKAFEITKELGLDINPHSAIIGAIRGEVLAKTPAPSEDLIPLWNQIDLKNGDVLVMIGYKE